MDLNTLCLLRLLFSPRASLGTEGMGKRTPDSKALPNFRLSNLTWAVGIVTLLTGLSGRTLADPSDALIAPSARSSTVWSTNSSIIFGDRSGLFFGDTTVMIPARSVLAGFGELEGKVFVSGKTEPGFVPLKRGSASIWYSRSPIGKLTVTGKYVLEKEGVLVIDVTSPRKHDLLRVHGTASLSGTLRVDSLGYRPKPGDRIPFLLADRIEGRFIRIKSNLPDRFHYDFKKVGKTGYLVVSRAKGFGR